MNIIGGRGVGLAITAALAWSVTPAQARFLQTDPVGYEDNVNLYVYTANDPINRLDPTGKRDVYIGGKWDKDYSKIVQSYAQRQMALNPGRDIQYFSHSEGPAIAAALTQGIPVNEPLNVIGHSLGGAEAIRQAEATGARIDNLVTIDPVSSVGGTPKLPNVAAWANVTADPASPNRSDTVASAGRALWGSTEVAGADVSVTSPASHGGFSTMMNDVNAPAAIDSSYRNGSTWCSERAGVPC